MRRCWIGLGSVIALVTAAAALPTAAAADDSPTLSIAPAVSVTEGTNPPGSKALTNAYFNVTLSQRSTSDVTFRLHTANGTATAPSDYRAKTNALYTIKAGKRVGVVTVQVVRDAVPESNETFTVAIDSASVPIGNATGTGTIVDDDTPPVSSGTFGSTPPAGDIDYYSGDSTQGGFWNIGGTADTSTQDIAMPFTVTRSGMLTGVGFNTDHADGDYGPLTVQLTRAGGGGPSTLLVSAATTSPQPEYRSDALTYLTFATPVAVNAGDQFDLVQKAPTGTIDGWLYTDTNDQAGTFYYSQDDGTSWNATYGRYGRFDVFVQ